MAPAKPTILTFHGFGSNATVHTVQLARLSRLLRPTFEIVTLEAPFPSVAGPGVLPFFEGCGPYKRWSLPSEKLSIDSMKRGEASSVMPQEVESLIRNTVTEVFNEGGKVVGLIGFSQGTRVVAGLLKACEIRKEIGGEAEGWMDFGFALSVCGSYPPPLIPLSAVKLLSSASLSDEEKKALREGKIQIPTLHLQGKQDEWEWAGKLLIDGVYEAGEDKSKVLELEMGHHYPTLPEDTERVKDWIFDAWQRSQGR
ncbi:citrinin biosynthesis oxidoreductase-like protein CtnB [Lojkania enalia]|uniref:Citrinin biosynthesis oxidoreductase-like protein CtnB n=1 Tax=Lojkania enalia TaxID=147567 RepID=A0A9P4KBT5_9PLEO|nr:citrinin biosynthesis oxidoreductase-like protein CtnB [Didymosphaeria enalia]